MRAAERSSCGSGDLRSTNPTGRTDGAPNDNFGHSVAAVGDVDGDGLDDGEEVLTEDTDPLDGDTDNDGAGGARHFGELCLF